MIEKLERPDSVRPGTEISQGEDRARWNVSKSGMGAGLAGDCVQDLGAFGGFRWNRGNMCRMG